MKKTIAILLALAMVLALGACSRGGNNDSAGDSDKAGEYELVIGHVYTEDSLEHAQMLKIKEGLC